MKIRKKRLIFVRETLRTLTEDEISKVVGGSITTVDTKGAVVAPNGYAAPPK